MRTMKFTKALFNNFALRAEEEAATEAKRQKIDIADDEVRIHSFTDLCIG